MLGEPGWLAWMQGDLERAGTLQQEASGLLRRVGDERGLAWSLTGLGYVAVAHGDPERAATLYSEALGLFRALGDDHGVAHSLANLGWVACDQDDLDRAAALKQEALELFRGLGDRHGAAWTLNYLAAVVRLQGDLDRAAALCAESLALFRELEDSLGIALCLDSLARLAVESRQPERAARLYGAAAALRDAAGSPLPPDQRADHERGVAAARAGLGEAAFAAGWDAGRMLPSDQASAEAIAPLRALTDPAATIWPRRSPTSGLSRRELDVLRLLVEGRSDREIATTLSLSHRTVHRHVTGILGTLRVETRTAAAALAVRRGFV